MASDCLSTNQKESFPSIKRRPTIEKLEFGHSKDFKKDGVISHHRFKHLAHFHYEHVEFDCIQAKVDNESEDNSDLYNITVEVNGKVWVVHRTYEHLVTLDKQLHSCVFDRSISQLADLQQLVPSSIDEMQSTVVSYLNRFSLLAKSSTFHCGTVLHFFEVDNKGNRLVFADDSAAINIPAIAAARAIKSYSSQASDELSLDVGDMVSVIDKPGLQESTWWRGKKKFEVGFFPSECVELIGGTGVHKPGDATDATKPVLLRRGKVITFLRMFFSSRPNRTSLKRNGIVKERVFSCDLGEHLSNYHLSVPQVLFLCCQVVELHGMIDGIYRLSGVASHVQLLRARFDEGTVDVLDDEGLSDLHTVTSVLKMYFRELPNPLITYQLYDSFCKCVELKGEERLLQLQSSAARLPPPHYRTAKYLFAHLYKMSLHEDKTGMNSKNLAIVWSPNLMRSDAMENGRLSPPEMLHTISVQATVVEAMITNYHSVFNVAGSSSSTDAGKGTDSLSSMPLFSPSTRLLSLVEAQQMMMNDLSAHSAAYRHTEPALSGSAVTPDVGEQDIVPVFHTVINFSDRRSNVSNTRDSYVSATSELSKMSAATSPLTPTTNREKSPSRWKSFFHRGRHHSAKSSSKKKKYEDPAITDSDIGHLTRPSQTNLKKLKATLSLTDIDIRGATGSCSDLLEQEHDEKEAVPLIRSASHESFFDSTSQLSPVPTGGPICDDESLAKSVTPGVVFKPAYTEPSDIIKVARETGTWKGSLASRPQHFHSQATLLNAKHKTAQLQFGSLHSDVQVTPELSSPRVQADFSDFDASRSWDAHEKEWRQLEMEQCVHQAEQARLSRSYSSTPSTSSTDRQQRSVRRRYTGDSVAEEGLPLAEAGSFPTTQTPTSQTLNTEHQVDEHIYANVSSVITPAANKLPAHADPNTQTSVTSKPVSMNQQVTSHSPFTTGHQELNLASHSSASQQATFQTSPSQQMSYPVLSSRQASYSTHISPNATHETAKHRPSYSMTHAALRQQVPSSVTSDQRLPSPKLSYTNNQQLPVATSPVTPRQQTFLPISYAPSSHHVPSPSSVVTSQQVLSFNKPVDSCHPVSHSESHSYDRTHSTAQSIPREEKQPIYPAPSYLVGPSENSSHIKREMVSVNPQRQHSINSRPAISNSGALAENRKVSNIASSAISNTYGYTPLHMPKSNRSNSSSQDSVCLEETGLTDAFSFSVNNINLVGSTPTSTGMLSSTQTSPSTNHAYKNFKSPSNVVTSDPKRQNSTSVYQKRPLGNRTNVNDRPHSVYSSNTPILSSLSADCSATSLPDLSVPGSKTQAFPASSAKLTKIENEAFDPAQSHASSALLKMPVSHRRRESDVDTAIANAESYDYMPSDRRLTRNVEYINKNLYEPDKSRRHHSTDGTSMSHDSSVESADTEPIYANVVFNTSNVHTAFPGDNHRRQLSLVDYSDSGITGRQKGRTPVALPRLNSRESTHDCQLVLNKLKSHDT
ncbi:hypothetical protein EB796_020674 [Bugula neritina]|uniref:ARHGAP32 n=1 Tax=Bugula neritina TaxID=10212 RepID=A0A7J7J588_BUGNE|nr:hypothetical protein EB796_020674 [Bugula neritina]